MDLKNTLDKLIKEKFNWNKPNWKKSNWGDVEVSWTEDNENWYYKYGNSIYVQAKQGDHTPKCYNCSSNIEFQEQDNSIWLEKFEDGPIGSGDTKIKHIPYCPKCEKVPEKFGVVME